MGIGGIDSLLDISRRALFTQSQSIRVIGNNLANVNTEGYSRRKTEIVATKSIDLVGGAYGTGSDVNKVIRITDQFLVEEQYARINDRSYANIRNEFLTRAESPFSVDATAGHIGYEMSQFFSALEDLQANPSSIPLRSAVVQQGSFLCNTIRQTYNQTADLQREADKRISVLVTDVNRLTGEIAALNSQIAAGETGRQENLTLRDEREQRLRELNELITVDTVENDDGLLIVTLENGFGLVTGIENNEIEFTKDPSFEPPGGYPRGLDGQELGFIVYDFDRTAVGEAHVNLTDIVAAGGGEIAGIFSIRGVQSNADTTAFDASGDLVAIASHVEMIARDLLTHYNAAHLGYDDPADDVVPNSNEPDGDRIGATPVFDPSSGDLNGNIPTDVFSLFGLQRSTIADISGDGLPNAGDLQSNVQYASSLEFLISDPSELALSLDLDGGPTFQSGDGRVLELLLHERTEVRQYALGNVQVSGTIEELYNTTVGVAGGLKARAENELFVSEDREQQVNEAVASMSGVSIDEEFAKLINFQRAYEASARMIRVGDELLSQILALLG